MNTAICYANNCTTEKFVSGCAKKMSFLDQFGSDFSQLLLEEDPSILIAYMYAFRDRMHNRE